jgi:hypothetical protein
MLAAVVAGAVLMPFCILGLKFIETTINHRLAMLVWFVAAFFIPVLLATVDFRYLKRRHRELGGLFRPMASSNDFRLFYFPGWRPGLVLVASAALSTLVLTALGVEF